MFRGVTIVMLCVTAIVVAGCGGSKSAGGSTTVIIHSPSSTALPARVYRVPSGSMEPTYGIGARVLVQQQAPAVGAVVIFHPPQGAEEEECGPTPHVVRIDGSACSGPIPREEVGTTFIKRIVAGAGDEIYVKEGHLYRQAPGQTTFVRAWEPYIKECGSSQECNFPTPITIPAGDWFLLGDNRGESDDSRFWGPVPTAWIVGAVTGIE
jgi:signal peptidase I